MGLYVSVVYAMLSANNWPIYQFIKQFKHVSGLFLIQLFLSENKALINAVKN